MIQAMIICPSTGRPVQTGLAFGNLAAFEGTTLTNNTVRCTECGEQHLVDKSTVKAFPQELA